MTTEEDKTYIKLATWNGEKPGWEVFKTKFESYLSQKDMVELLAWPDKDKVPKDNVIHPEDKVKKETKKALEMLVKRQNRKAAGVLLNCIEADTKEAGKAAFNIIKKTINASNRYAGGNFKVAWKTMSVGIYGFNSKKQGKWTDLGPRTQENMTQNLSRIF